MTTTPGTAVALPSTRQDDWNYAKALATAGMLPRQYHDSPGNVLVAMEYAKSLHLPLAQVWDGINVIEGKPSMSAQLMHAVVRAAGHSVTIETRGEAARCTITRGDDGTVTQATFTVEDARRAGLLPGKPLSNWAKYPQDMLVARAVSRACRMAAPDALAGVAYTPDELGAESAVVDGGAFGVETVSAPAAEKVPRSPLAATQTNVPTPGLVDVPLPEPDQSAPPDAEARTEWRAELDSALMADDARAIAELITQAMRAGWDDLADEGRTAATGLGISREPQQGYRE